MSIMQIPESCVPALCRPLPVSSIYCLASTCHLLQNMTYKCRQSPPPFLPTILNQVTWFLNAADASHLTTTDFTMSKTISTLLCRANWFKVPNCTCMNCRPHWAYHADPGQAIRRPPSPESPPTSDSEADFADDEDESLSDFQLHFYRIRGW
jgi:hypothetical protein